MKTDMKTERSGLTLSKKFIILILTLTLIFCFVIAGSLRYAWRRSLINAITAYGEDITGGIANGIDGDRLVVYLAALSTDDPYDATLKLMRGLQSDERLQRLCVFHPREEGIYYVYDVGETDPLHALGDFEPWRDALQPYVQQFLAGDDGIAPVFSTMPSGNTLTVYHAISDGAGNTAGYVAAEFDLAAIMAAHQPGYVQICTVTVIVALILMLLFLLYVHKAVVSPIRRISRAADDFLVERSDDESPEEGAVSSIARLSVNTRDELEDLCRSLKSMEVKIQEYISSLSAVTRLAETDSLTGLYNRDAFRKRVSAWLNNPLNRSVDAFFMIDIDHFKEINDTFGHLAGDNVLIELAMILKRVFRHSDEIARIGGDEFAVFCRSIGSSAVAAEKARQINQELNRFLPAEHARPATASIGISFVSRQGNTWTDLYEKADAALYRAKDAGRNCFHFCPDSTESVFL